MKQSKGQGRLLPRNASSNSRTSLITELSLSKDLLVNWQKGIHNYQTNLFQGLPSTHQQGSLFTNIEQTSHDHFDPLTLTPLPLTFWRWPHCSQSGPAIYLVMDRLENSQSHIMLYIGETIAAEKRWKGEHDCKSYISAYSEALNNAGIANQLSIRFWSDVPQNTKSRRKLEQELIQKWLPPFNKETRMRWNTPFTKLID